ncbi:MAG: hypothetical protein RX318_09915 [bacterium]|nr:hypothetical protein [bacterium]
MIPFIMTWLVNNLYKFLLGIIAVIISYLILLCWWEGKSLGEGTTLTLEFIFNLRSPNSVGLGSLIASLGWVVMFGGWLIIPTIIGIIVSELLLERTLWRELEAKLYIFGARRSYRGDDLDNYVKGKMAEFQKLLGGTKKNGR